MAKKARKRAARGTATRLAATGSSTTTINAWEDDPATGVLVSRPVPNVGKTPLAFRFPKPAPPPGIYQPGTAQFRYWTAAEALRRGADFWAARIPLATWQPGPVLPVLLDEGSDLNAYYDRKALNFFHGPSPHGTVYSGESPDVICHEMGHAILDSLKPQLWGAASHEAAAFHEAFGDISALMSGLQLPSLRASVLADTHGHLYSSSRLSRLAEQLGAAIRAQQPDAVDRDCLRNAVNSFVYQNPANLPVSAPAAQLSSEPHSFSRIFSGAFFEALGSILHATAANPAQPTEQELLAAANDLAGILITAIKHAPVVPDWYAQVAGGMVQAAGTVKKSYPAILKGVFVRRSILSLQSATSVESLRKGIKGIAAAPETYDQPLARVALPSAHYGLDKPLVVETASHPRSFLATAGEADASQVEPTNAVSSARAYLDHLFTAGRVDYAGTGRPETRIEHGQRVRTHLLVSRGGAVHLERRLFDCGLCRH